jgi:hypothetical protein
MKCHKCGKEATPLKDDCESQGGTYIVMWWCYDCDCEPERPKKKMPSITNRDVREACLMIERHRDLAWKKHFQEEITELEALQNQIPGTDIVSKERITARLYTLRNLLNFKPNGGVVAAIPPLAKAAGGVSLPHEL